MNKFMKDISDVVAGTVNMVTFLAFVIIYYSVLFSTDVAVIVLNYFGSIAKPLGWVVLAGLIAPLILAVVAFALFFFRVLAVSIGETEGPQDYSFFRSIWGLGVAVGTFSFVAVLSIFVSYQSNAYMVQIAPQIREYVASILR